jgi:prolyl oligopeptidase
VAETSPLPSAPAARRESIVDVYHGVEVPDPYRWLEDAASTETQTWVAEQNARTRQALDSVGSYDRWHERLLALMGLSIDWPDARRGDRLFASSRAGNQAQPILFVTSASDPKAPRRVLLDPATLAADGAVALDWSKPSRNGKLLAYGLSEGGTENSTLQVLDVDTGHNLPDTIPNTRACSLSWLPDNSGFYYSRYPEGDQYNRKIYRHVLGQPWPDDELIFGDLPVPDAWTMVTANEEGTHVLIAASVGWSRNDLHLLNLATNTWTTILEGVEVNTSLAFDGVCLVGVTNLNAPRGRVVSIPLATPDLWTTLVPETEMVIEFDSRSRTHRFVAGMRSGIRVLQQHELDGTFICEIALPAFAEIAGLAVDRDEDDFFLALTSFGLPTGMYRWSPENGLQRWATTEAAFDPSTIAVDRLTYPSLDGTAIGMYLVRQNTVTPTSETPVLLTGYGGFNIASTPAFSALYVAWCEAGGMVAVAGLRGGNEEGEDWHTAGMRAHKQNVFDDFHAAADFLVSSGRTSRERLAIRGGSNGGLLMGAAITQRPDLAKAVVCEVPLLDMIRFPQFLIARLWTHEYGDPDVAEEFPWLWAYSPYHHVQQGATYPATLITTAEGDTRVDPCHARKMAALLQWATSGDAPILLRQGERAGHGAGRPQAKMAADGADVLTFIGGHLNVRP